MVGDYLESLEINWLQILKKMTNYFCIDRQVHKLNNDLAPVVLFVYNRPLHTQQTLDTLQKNVWASSTELFIYSDQAKSEDEQENVDKVRALLKNITGTGSKVKSPNFLFIFFAFL